MIFSKASWLKINPILTTGTGNLIRKMHFNMTVASDLHNTYINKLENLIFTTTANEIS